MNKYAEGLLSSISFFTIIPLKKGYSINKYTLYFLSLIGIVSGLISGVIFYLLSPLSRIIASVCSISFLMIFYGLNHLDAIMDFGDSIMAGGDYTKKQEVIKDKYTGSGGMGLLFIVYLASVAFVSYFPGLYGLITIISAEIGSRYLMILMMYRSKYFGNGLGKLFIESLGNNKGIPIINIIPFIIMVFFNLYNVVILIIVVIVMYLFKKRVEKLYNGINGDIIGSTGEISRLLYYIFSFIFLASGLFYIL